MLGGGESVENIILSLQAFLQRSQQLRLGWLPEAIMRILHDVRIDWP